MKRFKSVILALALIMGIGMVKPVEAYAMPTETIHEAWLRYLDGVNGEWVRVGKKYIPLYHLGNGRVRVADFMSGEMLGTIHSVSLAKNYIVSYGVNFRSWYEVGDNIIGYIPKGSKVLVTSEVGNRYWAQVRWNDRVGYVSRQYLNAVKEFRPS